MIDVLCVPGTWDTRPGMIGGLTRHLDPTRFNIIWITYPATFALPISYDESMRIGMQQLEEAWCTNQHSDVVLVGYSQGAHIAGDFAAKMTGHPRLKAVALIADPKRPAGMYIGNTDPEGHGVAGQRWINHPNVWHAAIKGDVVCSANDTSLWRLQADLTQTANPNIPLWTRTTLQRLTAPGGMQLARSHWSLQEYVWGMLSTVKELGDVLRGVHTSYGVRGCPGTQHTYLEELAQRINALEERK